MVKLNMNINKSIPNTSRPHQLARTVHTQSQDTDHLPM